jgi:integrase
MQSVNIAPDWTIPKKLHRIPKKESYVPTCTDFRRLTDSLGQNASLAVHMALLAGLRDAEVYRVRWEHYHPVLASTVDSVVGLLSIPAEIRKNNQGNVVPVVSLLGNMLDTYSKKERNVLPEGTIIPVSKSEIGRELKYVSTTVGIRPWFGLQPARRMLCSLAEDAGYPLDSIALVTGHSRGSMVSRYSAASGHMDLKKEILEAVERRLV